LWAFIIIILQHHNDEEERKTRFFLTLSFIMRALGRKFISYLVKFLLDVPHIVLLFWVDIVQMEIVTGS